MRTTIAFEWPPGGGAPLVQHTDSHVVVVVVKLYLFRVTHFSNTILVSHETLRIIYNIFTMKEYYIYIYIYIYTTMHLKDDDTNVKA